MNEELIKRILAMATAEVIDQCIAVVMKEAKWYWDRGEWESANAIDNAARRLEEMKKKCQEKSKS
jgi:hypothetical protein